MTHLWFRPYRGGVATAPRWRSAACICSFSALTARGTIAERHLSLRGIYAVDPRVSWTPAAVSAADAG
jgi:hypothetical protein